MDTRFAALWAMRRIVGDEAGAPPGYLPGLSDDDLVEMLAGHGTTCPDEREIVCIELLGRIEAAERRGDRADAARLSEALLRRASGMPPRRWAPH